MLNGCGARMVAKRLRPDYGEEKLRAERLHLVPDFGVYPLLTRFFDKTGNYYRSKREPRGAMLFAPPNMLRAPPFSKLHPVSYRKVEEFACESASLC
jgi:hypothetical protein